MVHQVLFPSQSSTGFMGVRSVYLNLKLNLKLEPIFNRSFDIPPNFFDRPLKRLPSDLEGMRMFGGRLQQKDAGKQEGVCPKQPCDGVKVDQICGINGLFWQWLKPFSRTRNGLCGLC